MPPKTLLLAVVILGACGPDLNVESPDLLERAPERTPKKQSSQEKKGPEHTSQKKQNPAPTTYALMTTDAADPAVAPTWKTSFSVYSTYTLFIATEITGGVAGHHLQSVTLITPGSAVYQQLDLAFAIGVPATPTEQQAEQTSTGFRVWTSLPVAATTIQQLNLVGAWSAEVRIDSAATTAARSSFALY